MSIPPPDYDTKEAHHQGNPSQQFGPPQPNQQYAPGQMHVNQPFTHGQMMPPSQHTTVIVQQPASVQNPNILGSRDGHREWNSGLFSCFDDVGKCMLACFCQNCVLAEISSRLGECCCVTCCVPGGLATVRTRVRTLGGIRGSICKDYMATECCYLCAMCQIHRELDFMAL